jgi:hypothetical protein
MSSAADIQMPFNLDGADDLRLLVSNDVESTRSAQASMFGNVHAGGALNRPWEEVRLILRALHAHQIHGG